LKGWVASILEEEETMKTTPHSSIKLFSAARHLRLILFALLAALLLSGAFSVAVPQPTLAAPTWRTLRR
jgi:hypothetical protein